MKFNKNIYLYLVLISILLNQINLKSQDYPAHGALSDAFQLKHAGATYSSRSYLEQFKQAMHGQLSVSNMNGKVSYNYPISSYQVNGFTINTSMNYCDAINFESYAYEYDFTTSGKTYDKWMKFSQQRPAWIIGVNGFAVQAIFKVGKFYLRGEPFLRKIEDDDYVVDGTRTYEGNKLNWVIEGYNHCNRMNYFATQTDWIEGDGELMRTSWNDDNQDVIKILKSNGSILELRNSYRVGDYETNGGDDSLWYIGKYYSNHINSKGYATVEYVNLINLDPDFEYAFRERPRIAKFYSEDGMIYVFNEKVNIYYPNEYKFEEGKVLGTHIAKPSIFYLSEIHNAYGKITDFEYENIDIGRANIKKFLGHKFSYALNRLNINAMGKDITIEFDSVLVEGFSDLTPDNSTKVRFLRWDLPTQSDNYQSQIGYVSSITGPDGKKISFDYEPYYRHYVNYPFPFDHSGDDYTITDCKNFRMSKIEEPNQVYELKYYNQSRDTITSTDPPNYGAIFLPLNNTVDSLDLYRKDSGILDPVKTEVYSFVVASGLGGEPNFSTGNHYMILYDHRDLSTTYYQYFYNLLEPIEPAHQNLLEPNETPFLTHVVLEKITEKRDDYIKTTIFDYPSSNQTGNFTEQVFSHIWKPRSKLITISKLNGTEYDIYQRTKENYDYEYELQTDFDFRDPLTYDKLVPIADLDTIFGRRISKITTTNFTDADDDAFRRKVDEFIYLPLIDTTVLNLYYHNWKKIKSLERYYELIRADDPKVDGMSWEEFILHSEYNVFEVDTLDGHVSFAPISDILKKSTIVNPIHEIFSGISNNIETEIVINGEVQFNRGKVISDTIIGYGGATKFNANYEYRNEDNYSLANGLVSQVENSIGGLLNNQYAWISDFSDMDDVELFDNEDYLIRNPRGTVHTMGYGTILRTLPIKDFWYLSPLPLVEEKQIRKFKDLGSGIVLDTTHLFNFSSSSYAGLPMGQIGPNGNFSENTYDDYNRILSVTLPYDFYHPDKTSEYNNNKFDTVLTTDLNFHTTCYSTYKHANCWRRYVDSTEYYVYRTYGDDSERTDSTLNDLYTKEFYFNVVSQECPGEGPIEKSMMEYYSEQGNQSIESSNKKNSNEIQEIVRSSNYPRTSLIKKLVYQVPPSKCQAVMILDLDNKDINSVVDGDSLKLILPFESISGLSVTLDIIIVDENGNEALDTTVYYYPEDPYNLSIQNPNVKSVDTIDISQIKDDVIDDLVAGARYYVYLQASSGEIKFIADQATNIGPHFELHGEFEFKEPYQQRTVNYLYSQTYGNSGESVSILTKIDDRFISSDKDVLGNQNLLARSDFKFYSYDYDYLIERFCENPSSSFVGYVNNARGQVKYEYHNQTGFRTDYEYDGLGRESKITYRNDDDVVGYINNEIEIDYRYSDETSLGISDQDYFGFVELVTSINDGHDVYDVYNSSYYDRFGRLRMTINDTSDLRVTTKFEYDTLDRIDHVINPNNDTIWYHYDIWGQSQYKYHPDFGYQSYAYDDVGNLRFSQTQKQTDEEKLSFYQYDDLGRMMIFGEAKLSPFVYSSTNSYCLSDTLNEFYLFPQRFTDILDPNILHDYGQSGILTANKTLFMTPTEISKDELLDYTDIELTNIINSDIPILINAALKTDIETEPPYIKHPVIIHDETPIDTSNYRGFEDITTNSDAVLIAYYYDEFPAQEGAIWDDLQDIAIWDAVAPYDSLRNLKGQIATVAYREHAKQPFHYIVMSYDARGRVEAMMRFTENIGFDATYYEYNSNNQVIQINVADPMRSVTTWYGINENALIDSVWTSVRDTGLLRKGTFYTFAPEFPGWDTQPDTVDIAYNYTEHHLIDKIYYPKIETKIDHDYNYRYWLTDMNVTQSSDLLFGINNTFSKHGLINEHIFKYDSPIPDTMLYAYDNLNRIIHYSLYNDRSGFHFELEKYAYDSLGNRTYACSSLYNECGSGNQNYFYNDPSGPNRLSDFSSHGVNANFTYNRNGALAHT